MQQESSLLWPSYVFDSFFVIPSVQTRWKDISSHKSLKTNDDKEF
jgi:hypothetical protein